MVAVLVALGVIGALAGGGDEGDDTAAATTVATEAPSTVAATTTPATVAPTDPTDPAAPASTTGGTVAPASTQVVARVDVEVGDCVESLPEQPELFAVVESISCDEAHLAETHAQEDLQLDGPYPGNAALDAAARPLCLQRFTEYVGQPMDSTPFSITWFVPTETGWAQDDREVTCLVELPVPGTGSIRQVDVSNGWNGFQSITALQQGQCFDESADHPGLVALLDCAAPHPYEAVGVTRLEDGPFPADTVKDTAETFCLEAFEAYVGTSFDTSPLTMFPQYPSAETWDLGDRTLACIVEANGATGSVAGTGSGG